MLVARDPPDALRVPGGPRVGRRSAPLEGRRLVCGLAAALLAADQILRLCLGRLHLAPGDGRLRGDLALHHAGRVVAPVRAPDHLVSRLELVGHQLGISTLLMTWMTPLDARTSGTVTRAPPTYTLPWRTFTGTRCPLSVLIELRLTTRLAVSLPLATW